MLVAIRESGNIKERVDEIFEHADQIPAGEITNRIFEMLAEFMTTELLGIEKVDFELNVLAMNAPERVDKILAGAEGVGNMEYSMQRTSDFFRQKMQSGELKARVSSMELLTYISSAFSGIQMCCIVNNCYRKGPMSGFYQPKMQLRTLARTVNYLLGVE